MTDEKKSEKINAHSTLNQANCLLFSSYLNKYAIPKSSLLDKSFRKTCIFSWLKEISKNFQQGKYDKNYQALEKGLARWLNEFASKMWSEDGLQKNVNAIDQVITFAYQQLCAYIILKSKITPGSPTAVYPYKVKHSGVSMQAYFVREAKDGALSQIEMVLEAHDALQLKSYKDSSFKEAQSAIQTHLGSSLLSKETRKLMQSRIHHFHAEDYWFTVQLPKMLEHLRKRKDLGLKHPQDDNTWLLQLDTYPRLEFVMSSSPCGDCKNFFSELRFILNHEKIYFPIVIYSNTPYNTLEVDESPMSLVKYDGSYFVTGLAANMPYYAKFQKHILEKTLEMRLFSQEQTVFFQLDSIVYKAMPFVVAGDDFRREDFITSMHELFYGDGTVNWNTNCWMTSFQARLPYSFISTWENLNVRRSIEKEREDFAYLEEEYGPLNTAQEEVNQALTEEIQHFSKRHEEKQWVRIGGVGTLFYSEIIVRQKKLVAELKSLLKFIPENAGEKYKNIKVIYSKKLKEALDALNASTPVNEDYLQKIKAVLEKLQLELYGNPPLMPTCLL